MDNEIVSIHFSTLDRICEILECEPGDIIVRKKVGKEGKNK